MSHVSVFVSAACYEGLQLQWPAGKTQHPHQQCGSYSEEPAVRCGLSQDDYHSHIPSNQTGRVCFLQLGHFVKKNYVFVICRREGIEVRVVKRGEYDEEVVRWADAIISAGGRTTV